MSGGELLLLLVIALLAFGAHRLPEVGRTVGHGLREFQRGLNEARRAMTDDAPPPSTPPSRRSRLID